MERFFKLKDPWGHGLSLWVIVFLVFLLPLLGLGILGIRLENEVTSWLPEDDPDAVVLHWFHREFEQDSKVLLSWDSSSLHDPRLRELTRQLKAGSVTTGPYLTQGIQEVSTPLDLMERMTANRLTPQQALERLSGVLIGTGYAKIRLTAAGRRDSEQSSRLIQQAVERALDQAVQILPPVTNPDQVDIVTQAATAPEQAALTADTEAGNAPDAASVTIPEHDFQLKWRLFSVRDPKYDLARTAAKAVLLDGQPVVEDFFVAAGAPIAVAISLSPFGDDNLYQTLRAIESAALAAGIPQAEIRMGGSPIGRAKMNQTAARALWNDEYPLWMFHKRSPVLLSTIVGVLASFLMLRSARLAILVLAASVYTCLVILAIIPATGTTLNMVLVVLPNLLLVLTVSGAIHLANYWKHAASKGVPHPIAKAVGMAAMPCFLASATTAIGMISLLTASLKPVREFGIYSSLGCVISLAMILIGFPAMMSVWPGRPGTESDHHKEQAAWERLGRWLVRHRTAVCIFNLLLFVGSSVGLYWFRTETKIIRYFPDHSRIVQDYDFLETSLSGIVPVETVIRFNSLATGRSAAGANPDSESGTEASTDNSRINILQRMELVRAVANRIAQHRGISGTLALPDFRPIVETPATDASRLDKIKYGRTAQRYESEIFDHQADTARQFVTRVKQPLTVALHGREIRFEPGDEIWRIRAQSVVMSDVDYGDLVRDVTLMTQEVLGSQAGVDFAVTGLVPLFLRTQNALLESLINSFAMAFVVIAIVMIWLLKSFWSGLLSMLPNLFPIGVVFGLIAWAGIPVDVGTMITASVALGIAIDGTLHLLTWFQDGLRHGLPRNEAIVAALKHCGPAMWQTSVAIAIAMQMLIGADLLLISRFGWLMSSLIMMALIGDIILLPALLTGWLGQLIELTTKPAVPTSAKTASTSIPQPTSAAKVG